MIDLFKLNKTPKRTVAKILPLGRLRLNRTKKNCCNLNLWRVENGVEVFVIPIFGVTTVFACNIKNDGELNTKLGKFDSQKIMSATTTYTKWRTIVFAFFVWAIRVFLGWNICRFGTYRYIQIMNIGAGHYTQCPKVENEYAMKILHQFIYCWFFGERSGAILNYSLGLDNSNCIHPNIGVFLNWAFMLDNLKLNAINLF